ncbi:MAG TPA: hypothetical protein VEZ20_08785 [Allosphingosinicella sp.]|nr:hypothetical protein [Allosphingosinicella sp.]
MIHALILAAAAILVPEASSPQNDYNLSEAGRTRVFARSEAEFRNARILVSERTRAGWSTPRPIAFTDPRFSDSDPWLTPDGRTLYFISDRPAPDRAEGARDYDIWRAARMPNGAWSAPERLGPEVNSAGQELGPELHGGILYFSSARRSGRGGLDIYAAPAAGTGFAQAALLDGPFNGPASESDFTLSPDARTALIWRSGEGAAGRLHIARRTASGWTEPAPLPAAINRGPFNFTPSFSRDGRTITYASTGPDGLADIYRARLP